MSSSAIGQYFKLCMHYYSIFSGIFLGFLRCANTVAYFIALLRKFGFKNATNVLGSLTKSGHTGGVYNTDRICIPESHKMLYGFFVHVGETLTDLQVLALNCTKMRLAARFWSPDPLGEL